jgi:hypothetical protein
MTIIEPPIRNDDTQRVATVNRLMVGIHGEIEKQRGIVNLCDAVLAMPILCFVHWLARRTRDKAEAEIKSLRSVSAGLRAVRMLDGGL